MQDKMRESLAARTRNMRERRSNDPHQLDKIYKELKHNKALLEDEEDTFLEETVRTAPRFRRHVKHAESQLQVQYED